MLRSASASLAADFPWNAYRATRRQQIAPLLRAPKLESTKKTPPDSRGTPQHLRITRNCEIAAGDGQTGRNRITSRLPTTRPESSGGFADSQSRYALLKGCLGDRLPVPVCLMSFEARTASGQRPSAVRLSEARQSWNAGQRPTCASNTPVSICPCRLTCTNSR
jgi:hypothetical protein